MLYGKKKAHETPSVNEKGTHTHEKASTVVVHGQAKGHWLLNIMMIIPLQHTGDIVSTQLIYR